MNNYRYQNPYGLLVIYHYLGQSMTLPPATRTAQHHVRKGAVSRLPQCRSLGTVRCYELTLRSPNANPFNAEPLTRIHPVANLHLLQNVYIDGHGLNIVMEYAQLGSLLGLVNQRIQTSGGPLPEHEARYVKHHRATALFVHCIGSLPGVYQGYRCTLSDELPYPFIYQSELHTGFLESGLA